MRKPDDELKLDINEIFGASETVPEPNSLEAVLAPLVGGVPAGTEIKFNDLSNTPVAEPVVLTVKSKHATDFDHMMSSAETAAPEVATQAAEKTKDVPSESEPSSIILKPGTSGRSSDPKDFFLAYDYFREVFLEELKDSAGPRKTAVMLVKTFEAAREKHPEIFRNANWDANGNLLEDGSLNIQKIMDNKSALDSKQADITLDSALLSLLNLRLQAVEKGLGPDYAAKIKTRLKRWTDEESQKNGYGKNDPKVLRRLGNYLL
jgi:hypothetical protein